MPKCRFKKKKKLQNHIYCYVGRSSEPVDISKGQDLGRDYLDSSAENVIMHEGQRLLAAVVIFFKVKTKSAMAVSYCSARQVCKAAETD